MLLALLPFIAGYSPPHSGSTDVEPAKVRTGGGFMNCGSVELCGVLTLETGLGSGYYAHARPSPHGLWPETDDYGSSECVAPSGSSADPTIVYACYEDGTASKEQQIAFETHEWEKHGACAGVKDEADFFSQICSLSSAPVAVLSATRASGATDIATFASALQQAGYPVYDTDAENSQILLSACAGSDGTWKLAAVSSFDSVCSGGDTPSKQQCLPNEHGPPCNSDADCDYKGCVRCAHSGYCTSVPQ